MHLAAADPHLTHIRPHHANHNLVIWHARLSQGRNARASGLIARASTSYRALSLADLSSSRSRACSATSASRSQLTDECCGVSGELAADARPRAPVPVRCALLAADDRPRAPVPVRCALWRARSQQRAVGLRQETQGDGDDDNQVMLITRIPDATCSHQRAASSCHAGRMIMLTKLGPAGTRRSNLPIEPMHANRISIALLSVWS